MRSNILSDGPARRRVAKDVRGKVAGAVAGVVLVFAIASVTTLATTEPTRAYSHSTLESYVRDGEYNWAYRMLTIQWQSWSGGETNFTYVGSRGKATYGYSFSDWGILVDCFSVCPQFRWGAEEQPNFYNDWTMPIYTVQQYYWGYLTGDISVYDGWCHTFGNCYHSGLYGNGSGWGVCVPYLSSLGETGYRRWPYQYVGGC